MTAGGFLNPGTRRRWMLFAAIMFLVSAAGLAWILSTPRVSEEAQVAAFGALIAELKEVQQYGTLIVVDFTQPSQVKRLGVLDLTTMTWKRHARVTHGKNSGLVYARDLSDEPGSLKSSAGLFRVAEQFDGIHGVSLRLEGLEPGRNGNAEERGIIVHAAEYASVSTVFLNWKERFRLGRSEGCFALTPGEFGGLVEGLERPAWLYAYDGEGAD